MGGKKGFDRKIFTAGLFLHDLGFLILHIPHIISMSHNKTITKKFVEKIMMVTTAVNGCMYCSWFHAKQALASEMNEEEIKNIMNLQFNVDADEYELVALYYAQHFAETNRNPDPKMTKKLFDYYGEKTAKQIILVIRMIFFGNLYGNTWDAVISRFRGKPAPNSNVVFEIVFFLLNFFIMVPVMLLQRRDEKVLSN